MRDHIHNWWPFTIAIIGFALASWAAYSLGRIHERRAIENSEAVSMVPICCHMSGNRLI